MLAARSPILSVRFFQTIIKSMTADLIVPDVIDTAPHQVVKVSYPSGFDVNLDNVLTPTQTKDIPAARWNHKSDHLYTLCMIDPDAPSRKNPIFREWQHWLVGNVPGDSVVRGEVLAEYVGSGPPEGTGLHRYVFLVYKQAKKLTFKGIPRLTDKSADKSEGFCIRKFAIDHQLGYPVAGNYYQAQYDKYVPILYKQLGA